MNPPLVSIILPLYNPGEFLSAAMASLLSQTYHHIEILCIDDASIDGTPERIAALAGDDTRIRLERHTENHGPGWCRNRGIELASGKYITFFDHDDIADSGWIAELVRAIEKYGTPVAMCGGNEFFSDSGVLTHLHYKKFAGPVCTVGRCHNEDLFTSCIPPWLKLYDREFIVRNKIRFDENRNEFDDVIFHFFSIYYAREIAIVDLNLYHHRVWPGSITSRAKQDKDKYFDHLKTLEAAMQKAREAGLRVEEVVIVLLPFLRYHVGLVRSRRKFYAEINRTIRNCSIDWRYRPKRIDLLPVKIRRTFYALELFFLDNARFRDKFTLLGDGRN